MIYYYNMQCLYIIQRICLALTPAYLLERGLLYTCLVLSLVLHMQSASAHFCPCPLPPSIAPLAYSAKTPDQSRGDPTGTEGGGPGTTVIKPTSITKGFTIQLNPMCSTYRLASLRREVPHANKSLMESYTTL